MKIPSKSQIENSIFWNTPSENSLEVIGVRFAFVYVDRGRKVNGFELKANMKFNSNVRLSIVYHCGLEYVNKNEVLL